MNTPPPLLLPPLVQQAATVSHCTECMALSDTHWLWGWALCRLRSNGPHIILRSNPLRFMRTAQISSPCMFCGPLALSSHPIQFLGEYAHTNARVHTCTNTQTHWQQQQQQQGVQCDITISPQPYNKR